MTAATVKSSSLSESAQRVRDCGQVCGCGCVGVWVSRGLLLEGGWKSTTVKSPSLLDNKGGVSRCVVDGRDPELIAAPYSHPHGERASYRTLSTAPYTAGCLIRAPHKTAYAPKARTRLLVLGIRVGRQRVVRVHEPQQQLLGA